MSYPDASGFSECNAFQLSPRAPAASLRPHQPCSAEPVPLLPYGPGARLPLAFIHVRSESARAVGRFLVAQHLQRFAGRAERVERSITAPSARSDVASPIRGTTLRQRLNPRGCVDLSVWRPMCPFGRVYSAAWRAAQWGLSNQQTPRCRPPSMHARTRICARSSPVLHDI